MDPKWASLDPTAKIRPRLLQSGPFSCMLGDMGHYASEMMGDGDYKPSHPKRIPLSEKPRYEGGQGVVEGSTEEDTVLTEYAVDFDRTDYRAIETHGYPPLGRTKEEGPEGWWLAPARVSLNYLANSGEEKVVEQGEYFARMHGTPNEHGESRPARVMKRTVTYGPWEVLSETTDHQEGWY